MRTATKGRPRRIKNYKAEEWHNKTEHKGMPVRTVAVLASVSPNGVDNKAPVTISRAPWETDEIAQ
ncbi:hypothetical protein AB9F29_16790 [Falsihalocynthiibacter sp. S25ZX9]|uniref:hypothetical protein n=1 Tax=Falsihalocynthiibacter sp. S25ZX9 TaxID=3240870 RepID=UPI00351091FE